MAPWAKLPDIFGKLEVSVLLPVPMDRAFASQNEVERLRRLLDDITRLLQSRSKDSFEILVAPYGHSVSSQHPFFREITSLSTRDPRIHLLAPSPQGGRSAALRDAFLASRGKALFAMHYEQPCEASFYHRAAELLAQGHDLIRANRRLPESRFKVPVRLLPLVYGRHRLGLLFNRFVRLVLPIETTDTHSGSFVIRRKLAAQAFFLQNAPDFLFDLELALVARGHGAHEMDLPVVLYLAQEKGAGRMFRETLSILAGLPRLVWLCGRGYYGQSPPLFPRHYFTADDWGISPGVNEGILELARLGVIRRVSLMSECKYLRDGLEELRAIPGIELGLHFNLTYGKQPSRPLGFLLRWLTALPPRRAALREHVRSELTHQLKLLHDVGVKPHYLDGHHHIHLVPGLLGSLADLLEQEGIRHLRLPTSRRFLFSGKLPLVILSKLARPVFRRNKWRALPFYYPSARDFERPARIRHRLRLAVPTEVVTHPSARMDAPDWEHADPYIVGRLREIEALRLLHWAEKDPY